MSFEFIEDTEEVWSDSLRGSFIEPLETCCTNPVFLYGVCVVCSLSSLYEYPRSPNREVRAEPLEPIPEVTCEGCIYGYENQQGHMGSGGCLEETMEPLEDLLEEIQDVEEVVNQTDPVTPPIKTS